MIDLLTKITEPEFPLMTNKCPLFLTNILNKTKELFKSLMTENPLRSLRPTVTYHMNASFSSSVCAYGRITEHKRCKCFPVAVF